MTKFHYIVDNKISREGLVHIIKVLNYQSMGKCDKGIIRLVLEGNDFGSESEHEISVIEQHIQIKRKKLSEQLDIKKQNSSTSSLTKKKLNVKAKRYQV